MIIKSMARKDPTFWQLAQYIERDASGDAFTHNLMQSGADTSAVANAFDENHAYLPKRKRGNALYHEIIALEPQPHLSPDRQITVLNQLAARYCERRAPDQMAWGKVHLDTDYPHLHLMISANAKSSAKRHRLSKVQFTEIQRDVEGFALAQFPELEGRAIYNRSGQARTTPTKPNREGELERRTKRPSAKTQVADQLRQILGSSDNASLVADLGAAGFDLNKRGRNYIVTNTDTGRKYRLKTLGLETDLAAAMAREKQTDDRAQTLLKRRAELEDRIQNHLHDFEQDHER